MRITSLIMLSLAMSGGGAVLAQSESIREQVEASPSEAPEEVIVRGRRLSELRYEVQGAREHAYDLFNALNSNDEFDVYCHNERKYHSRATRRVCRARFESDASSAAATDYFSALRLACDATVDCMFSERAAGAISASQAALGQAGPKRDAMTQEIWRVASEHEEFAQAIIDFYEMNQRYEAATSRRRDDD